MVALVIAVVVIAYFGAASYNNPYTSYIDEPVNPTLAEGLTGYSNSALAAVGAGTGTPPTSIVGSALTNDSKPEVLYIGGEFCPYCAVIRWSLIIALSKFGNFTGLRYMLSSGTNPTNPNTPTFTFANATYSSKYISFVAVEHWDRADNPFQPLSSDEQALFLQYDSGTGIPFVDFANQFLVKGAPGGTGAIDLSGQNWTQVENQLISPSAPVAQAMVGSELFHKHSLCD
jgi:Domain of unknown function (DUF929)